MILPITQYKEEIIEAVRNNSVTIITAETGSGKSTQIPQYLAEHFNQVVVTEPRIMAAKTLAKRVADEMSVTLGEEVGYMTAYDQCCLPSSNILFCTDGLQLIRTIFSKDTEAENVLIIDEVHEWNLNIETLIAWCKFMQDKWNTKVVIMSATIETKELANYFGNDVTVFNIPGKLYEVKVEERPKYALIDTIKENINFRKNILVFVAGKKEINDVIDELKEEDATVLPLHGEMEWEGQKKCFENYSNSKVVVATNVAQTSLTIPDIDVVVDTGNARISIAENGIQGLFLKDISRSDITQRKGRAGRTKDGKYFLCSYTPIRYREENTIPEIQRSILDRVVLQLAAIGLDAEELEFYHQPEMEKITMAKKELSAIGALYNNKVTELGHKMVKIPVSVQFARMIVEAEKYGVTEQVLTIAAIIEMGGLLDKEGRYRDFTAERESDLLAELDVWNHLNKIGDIDFKRMGVKKKNFYKIKEHIQKLKATLEGIVEINSNNDKRAIIKSCLSGLVSHIYIHEYDYRYHSESDGPDVQLDKHSCILYAPKFLIGIPKTIEFKDRYSGCNSSLTLVKFASKIDKDTLIELVPDRITEETSLRYSISMDAVEITTKKYFAGTFIDDEIVYEKNHPQYDELKGSCTSNNNQEVVVIDGKQFRINRDYWDGDYYVLLDDETLFTTNVKEVFLDSGKRVRFKSHELPKRVETNIVALRNAVEVSRIARIKSSKKYEYENVKINTIYDFIENADKVGKVQLTMCNGGFGNEPIFAYGYIALKKKTVTLEIGEDEEVANSDTLEALQYLFYKEIEKKYGESKFSHQTGKKILTESEMEAKKDFDSLVREVLVSLTTENVLENLEFLEEYYQEIME